MLNCVLYVHVYVPGYKRDNILLNFQLQEGCQPRKQLQIQDNIMSGQEIRRYLSQVYRANVNNKWSAKFDHELNPLLLTDPV